MSIPELTESQKSKNLTLAVAQLVYYLKLDFGKEFKRQIPDDEQDEHVTKFMTHMIERLSELGFKETPELVAAGYKLALAEHTKIMPSGNQLITSMLEARKQFRQAEKNRLEAERVSALPPPKPTRTANPIQMLKEAMARIAEEEKDFTKEQKRAAHLKRLADHDKLIAEFDAKTKRNASSHPCSSNFCTNPGTMSHGTTGAGNFYCTEHFLKNF